MTMGEERDGTQNDDKAATRCFYRAWHWATIGRLININLR